MATEDDEDDEEDILLVCYLHSRTVSKKNIRKYKKKRDRRVWIHETLSLRNTLGEFHRLIQELLMDTTRYQQYFRMTPDDFQELVLIISPLIHRSSTTYREAISDSERLAITLR
jgi:hypothetical protein